MAKETRHFQKAPIVEAIVGIDFKDMLGEDSLSVLKTLGEALQPAYPTSEDIVMGQLHFQVAIGSQAKQQNTHLGYFFKSADRLQVVQARRNGFAFSRLAPYRDWEHFIFEAKRTWTLYRRLIGPSKVARWTIRYINKLSWPVGDQIEDYLQIYPHIPESLPQTIQGLFMRIQAPIFVPPGLVNQQLVVAPPEQEGKVSFILDNEFNFETDGQSDTELWAEIDSCRDIKNRFFVNSITDKTKEMIA